MLVVFCPGCFVGVIYTVSLSHLKGQSVRVSIASHKDFWKCKNKQTFPVLWVCVCMCVCVEYHRENMWRKLGVKGYSCCFYSLHICVSDQFKIRRASEINILSFYELNTYNKKQSEKFAFYCDSVEMDRDLNHLLIFTQFCSKKIAPLNKK